MNHRLLSRTVMPMFVALSLIPATALRLAAEDPRNPQAAPVVTGKSDTKMLPIDDLLTKFLKEHQIPGAAVAVTRQRRLVYSRGFGYAEVETQSPVEPDALFRIASISKPITAIAVLQLVEQGKLDLDERAFSRLWNNPALKPHGTPDPRLAEITVRQLLQHTGGWDRDKSFDPMFRPIEIARVLDTAPPAGPSEIIRYMGGQRLDFPPGERYAYSNFGYSVLGRIIEQVSGQPYDAYVKEHVLMPLGITRMQLGKTLRDGRANGEVCYYEPPKRVGPAVRGPNIGQDVPLAYGTWNLEAMDAHGGWIASAVDLVRLAAAFDDPEHCPLLKPASIAEMFARPPGLAGHDAEGVPARVYYGLGWFVRLRMNEPGLNAWHTGSLDGTSTILVRRHDGFNWAILFNSRNSEPTKAPARLIDPLMHMAVDQIEKWPEGDSLEITP